MWPNPTIPSASQRWDSRWFFLILAGVALLYGRGIPHGVMTDDSAEFQTLFVTLGRAHAPGYPLLLCLGKCFAMLPLGEIAWRGALLSAMAGIATVALVYRLTWRITGSTPSAAVAALALALSHTFWMQSLLPEAYALNALFLLILLYMMERARRDPGARGRAWLASALLTGLAFGNHQTLILFAPVGAAWFLWLETRRREGRIGSRLALGAGAAAVCGLLGMSVYVVLAVRMAALGFSLADAIALARGGDARDLVGVFGPGEILKRFMDFCFYLAYQFPGPAALLAVIGLGAGWRRDRPWTLVVLALALVTMAWGLNFDSSDIYVFYIPAYLSTALLVGMGFAWLLEVTRARRQLAWVAGALALAVVVCPPLIYTLSWSWTESRGAVLSPNKGNLYYLWPPRRSADWMADNVRCLMEAAPPHSLFLSDWSNYHIAVYFQQIERFRRDLLVLDRERNQTGINTWIRKTREFFADRTTPVITAGSDRHVAATFGQTPFGPGFITTAPGQAPSDWMAMAHSEWAFRGRLKKIHVSPFYTGAGALEQLALTIQKSDDPSIRIPARRPLYDHAGQGQATLGFQRSEKTPDPSPARSVIWPLAIPHHLEDGRPTPPGEYGVWLHLGEAADSPTTQVQTFQLR